MLLENTNPPEPSPAQTSRTSESDTKSPDIRSSDPEEPKSVIEDTKAAVAVAAEAVDEESEAGITALVGSLKISAGDAPVEGVTEAAAADNDDDISEEHMLMILAFCDLAGCDFDEAKKKLKVSAYHIFVFLKLVFRSLRLVSYFHNIRKTFGIWKVLRMLFSATALAIQAEYLQLLPLPGPSLRTPP